MFVPSDASFDRLVPELADALTQGDLDNEVLYSLLGHHYVHQLYPSSDWEQGPQRTWRGGGRVELTLDPLTWGGCPIVHSDIRVDNGYIHVIDGVVVPEEVRQAATG